MIERQTLWLTAGFVAGLLLTGIPYWRLPYNADYFADPFVLGGFVGLAVVAAILVAGRTMSVAQALGVTVAAFPVAVMIRVVVDTAKDPTDHNLWPFELIFAIVVSLAAILPGLVVGAIARRLRG